jgi:pyruvate dehydrogenase E2 component (dihydrolipoamide acetyltransferase)
MKTFDLPDLGEGLQEAEIVGWHVGPGDHVVADQPLVSVETDKAVVEVPSPFAGRVARLFAGEGDIVKVGSPLVAFAEEGTGAVDTGTVVGDLGATSETVDEAAGDDGAAAARAAAAAAGVRATPAVRALARKLGVDLTMIEPTGPGGVVTARDVEAAAHEMEGAEPLEPLRGVRRAMAQRMAQAHAEVVPVTVSDEADIECWRNGRDVTIRVVRALVAGCRAEPALNAWYDSRAGARRLHKKVDLGIAVDTPDGLFVPVLRDVANREPADLRRGLDRMRADIRARSIPPEELRGATITLSNFGMIAGRYASPVVVPPQVAILSTGRVTPQVVAADGKPAVHRTIPLSLTVDHRVVTGGEAARFLAAVIADLERPD